MSYIEQIAFNLNRRDEVPNQELARVFTNVWGVYTIINLAGNGFYKELKKELFRLQDTCRNIDFPKRAESMVSVIQEEDLQEYCKLLEGRIDELTNAGSKRLLKVIKSIRK